MNGCEANFLGEAFLLSRARAILPAIQYCENHVHLVESAQQSILSSSRSHARATSDCKNNQDNVMTSSPTHHHRCWLAYLEERAVLQLSSVSDVRNLIIVLLKKCIGQTSHKSKQRRYGASSLAERERERRRKGREDDDDE